MNTKTITRTAVLLALCIASQFLKNTSVYITGPLINLFIIIAGLSCGPVSAVILSVITPITAFLITGSPLMAAIPAIIPCIMAGNAILGLCAALFSAKAKSILGMAAGLLVGSVTKAAFMWITIVKAVLSIFGPNCGLPEKALTAARTTFSVTQLITALIGSALAFVIWPRLKKFLKEE